MNLKIEATENNSEENLSVFAKYDGNTPKFH